MVGPATIRVRKSRTANRFRAKSMRHDPAYVERMFWQHIRDRKLSGWKFKRQVPIVDYVCSQKKVIVELDGPVHALRPGRDKERDASLRNHGYIVVHFKNEEVLADLQTVLTEIVREVEAAPSPWPSPPKGERGSLRLDKK